MALSLEIFDKLPFSKPGGNFYTFLVCLFIALVFWLLNAFTKTYTTTIQVPVAYTHIPENMVFVKPPPSQVPIEIQGFGFNLMTFSLGRYEDTLTLNTAQLGVSKEKETQHKQVSSNKLYELLNGQFSGSVRLNKVLMDSLSLDLENKASKQVSISPALKLSFKDQFLMESITTDPEKIWVSGPASKVNGLVSLPTDSATFTEIEQSFSVSLAVMTPSGVTAQEKEVNTTVKVQRYTEAQIQLPVRPIHLPEGFEVTFVPNSVEVTYWVGVSEYGSYSLPDFSAVVDFVNYTEGTHRLPVSLTQKPGGIKVISLSPQKVEFIVRKREE